MSEEYSPEINVDELMQRIREEVTSRCSHPQSITTAKRKTPNLMLEYYTPIFNFIEASIRNAESRAESRTKWPENLNKFPFTANKNIQKIALKILNFIFKDQREVNFNLLGAVKKFLTLNQQMIEQITSLKAQMNEHMSHVDARVQAMDERLSVVDTRIQAMDERLAVVDTRLQTMDERLGVVDTRVQTIDERLGVVDTRVQTIDERLGVVDARVQTMDERLGVVDARVQTMDERLGVVDARVQTMDERLGVVDARVQTMDERLGVVDARVQAMNEYLAVVDTRVQTMDERLGVVDTRLQAMDEPLGVVCNRILEIDDCLNQSNDSINSWMNSTIEHLDTVERREQLIDEHLKTLDTSMHNCVQELAERLSGVDNCLQAINQHLGTVDNRMEDFNERYVRNDSYLKSDLVQQKRLITLFLETVQRQLPEHFSQEQLKTFVSEEQHSLDAFYAAFEDEFRGSRQEILNRLKVYLPLLQEAKVGTPDLPILDVGCGRGEWLELLRESQYIARGIDINRVMVDACIDRGLEVMESDLITYLQSLPDASLGAITGFHIIEHLSFPTLIKLLDETVRVLARGGLAIFETPNPENVLVGSYTFYLDPTHRNPLPSPMIKFMAEYRGLCRVNVMHLHPYPINQIWSDFPGSEQLSNYFYGPQDYAVIGYKE